MLNKDGALKEQVEGNDLPRKSNRFSRESAKALVHSLFNRYLIVIAERTQNLKSLLLINYYQNLKT